LQIYIKYSNSKHFFETFVSFFLIIWSFSCTNSVGLPGRRVSQVKESIRLENFRPEPEIDGLSLGRPETLDGFGAPINFEVSALGPGPRSFSWTDYWSGTDCLVKSSIRTEIVRAPTNWTGTGTGPIKCKLAGPTPGPGRIPTWTDPSVPGTPVGSSDCNPKSGRADLIPTMPYSIYDRGRGKNVFEKNRANMPNSHIYRLYEFEFSISS
jgi:hypothetical protein